MKRSIKEVASVLLVVAVLVAGMLSGASEVQGAGLAEQIQGSWSLVSIYNEQDGKKTDVFGPNPRGSMLVNPDGRYSYILMRASLPKFASNARQKGTAEENQAVVVGSMAYYGTYKVVSDKEQKVNLHVDGSTFPNWDGQDQKRIITVEGDEMKIINPTPSIGGGTNTIVWKRAK
ncbi:MAG: lipocalin-like domain-containing protein [Nitrospirae bacterium]|nr:lipocalin-like domain-containing protein [Nitrospirota bacterium]